MDQKNKKTNSYMFVLIAVFLGVLIYFMTNNDSSNDSLPDSTDSATLTQASIIAQDFVKKNFAYNCVFEEFDIRGGETTTPNRFKVLQKFTSSKFGYEQEYVYRIFIQYYGGEWEDIKNWDYGQLVIEDTSTGKQYIYHGTMKEKDTITSGTIDVAGISFNIAEQKSNAIRIYINRKLTIEEARKVCKELRSQYDVIQIATTTAHERGDEYMALSGGYFFEYSTNTIIKEAEFLK